MSRRWLFHSCIIVGTASVAGHSSGSQTFPRLKAAEQWTKTSELGSQVLEAADVEVDALLLDLKDMATTSGSRPSGAYARLLEYDASRNGLMLDTLRAWLDAHGEIGPASAMAHVHQNTFRYPLRRIGEVGSFALADPRERLALLLQFQILPPAEWLDRLKGGDDQ